MNEKHYMEIDKFINKMFKVRLAKINWGSIDYSLFYLKKKKKHIPTYLPNMTVCGVLSFS